MNLKLYRVTCRGMHGGMASSQAHGIAYVVAEDSAAAYRKVRAALDSADLGFAQERALDKVELIAEDADYPECGHKLLLP